MQRPAAAMILIALLLSAQSTVSALAGPIDDGVEAYRREDFKEAYRIWKPLAEQGNAIAQYNIGAMYANGEGVSQDYAEAMKWFRLAADQGYAGAQYSIGNMYNIGQGVSVDLAEARKWFQQAAEQGWAPAQLNFGVIYARGLVVPQDYVLAYMWFSLAASTSQGAIRMAAMENLDLAASKMEPAQIAEAQRLAREWKPKKEK